VEHLYINIQADIFVLDSTIIFLFLGNQ